MLYASDRQKEGRNDDPDTKAISYTAKLVDISINESSAACAIVKDGGDDPDITTGAHIVAEVAFMKKRKPAKRKVGRKIRLMLCSRSSYVAEKASAE